MGLGFRAQRLGFRGVGLGFRVRLIFQGSSQSFGLKFQSCE